MSYRVLVSFFDYQHLSRIVRLFFFFNDTATTEIYTTDTLFPYTTLFRSLFPHCRRLGPQGSRADEASRARQPLDLPDLEARRGRGDSQGCAGAHLLCHGDLQGAEDAPAPYRQRMGTQTQ